MRILIADDNSLFRAGLKSQIIQISPKAFFHEVDNYPDAINILMNNPGIEMVFVDPMLSGMDWKIGIEELLRQSGSAKVVVTSSNPRFDDFYYALSRARGRVFACLPKKEQSKSTFSILKMILSGSSYYPPSVGSRTMISGVTFSDKPAASSKPLTVRQSEVLSFLGRGLSNKQIAHEMSVSEATVKLHINALLRNLSATNRTMAVITAQQHGLL